MQDGVKQVFYFHADASSLGGFFEEPYRAVAAPCSVSLPPAGGIAKAEFHGFGFEGVSAKRSLTFVSGRPDVVNGPWVQRVVSVVEDFELLGRIKAEKLIAQMFIIQPKAGEGVRRISFAGSQIVNLRIDDQEVTPVFNSTLLPEHHRGTDAYEEETEFSPEMGWTALQEFADGQGAERLKGKDAPPWAVDRFGWIGGGKRGGAAGAGGYTLCSLVDEVKGVSAGESFAHSIVVPDFGRIFLAEAVVSPYAVNLTMFRAELGCKVSGAMTAAAIGSNGTTCPPS